MVPAMPKDPAPQARKFSPWIPAAEWEILSELAKNWTESRTAVILRLIREAEGAKLKVQK